MIHRGSWLRGLAVALMLAAPAITAAAPPARFKSEQSTARVDYWQLRTADIARQLADRRSLRPVRIVFVGDSITDFWHLDANPWFPGKFCGRTIWDESFGGAVPGQTALNLGVSGDRIEHVLHRILPAAKGGEGWLDRADLQPETIFVMLGINNSFDAEVPGTDSIYRGVLTVVARIHERKPKAKIVIQSLLPTDDPAKSRDLVLPVNAMLRSYAKTATGADYLDLYPAFVDEQGAQLRNLFNDALHPSREGYAVWRDQLTGYLRAAPSDSAR